MTATGRLLPNFCSSYAREKLQTVSILVSESTGQPLGNLLLDRWNSDGAGKHAAAAPPATPVAIQMSWLQEMECCGSGGEINKSTVVSQTFRWTAQFCRLTAQVQTLDQGARSWPAWTLPAKEGNEKQGTTNSPEGHRY